MATLVREQQAHASWRDYLELTKPRVVVLMLITSLVGMFLATRAGVAWEVLIFGNLGIGLCAGDVNSSSRGKRPCAIAGCDVNPKSSCTRMESSGSSPSKITALSINWKSAGVFASCSRNIVMCGPPTVT